MKFLKTYLCTSKNRVHTCGEVYCKMCYILKDKSKLKENSLFIYNDFETCQKPYISGNKEHIVNLCVVHQSCSNYSNISDIKQLCHTCGIREHVFRNNPVENFVNYGLLPRTSFSSIICIAHNVKAFDCQFILKFLVDEQNVKPKLILNGSKIIMIY